MTPARPRDVLSASRRRRDSGGPRTSRRLASVAVLAALSILPAGASAQVFPRVVNGVNSHDYPTTGSLLYSGGSVINEDNAEVWCSGTLIGCRTFLTAGHCVDHDERADRYWVYLQHAGLQRVASITVHPGYGPIGFPANDLAVLKLDETVTGITPSPINTVESPPVGTPATIVGFGRTGGSAIDYGIKRVGLVETTDCSGAPLSTTELVCWQFLDPIGPPGEDSNTCNGDSGGPLFASLGGQNVVAGVTSGGTSNNCLPSDDSFDVNVFTYRSFIEGELGTDPTVVCGGLPPIGDPHVTVIGHDGYLDSGHPSDSFTIQVTEPTQELRFGLTGEDDGGFNVDLFVKEGAGAGPGDFDCAADGAASVGECLFSNPAQGEWSVFVNRASSAGEYQVTTTIFAPEPAVCGNDIREFGEECDGTDDTMCPDECLEGCSCPTCPLVPSTGCITGEPGRSSLSISDSGNDARDSFKWKLARGGATDVSAFFNPAGTASAHYRLCMYENAGSGALTVAEVAPLGTCSGKPCWKTSGKRGFKYKDRTGASAGITDIKLRAGSTGKPLVLVKGHGPGFATPAPPLQMPAIAQLTITDGDTAQCWQTTFSSASRNDPGAFKAKGP